MVQHDEAARLQDIINDGGCGAYVCTARSSAELDSALDRAGQGERVLVFCAPAVWSHLSQKLALHVTARPERDSENPHVTAKVLAQGEHESAGSSLLLMKAGSVTAQDDLNTLATWSDGQTAAVAHAAGDGRVVLVAGMLANGTSSLAAGWARKALKCSDIGAGPQAPLRKAPEGGREVFSASMNGWVGPESSAAGVNDPSLLASAAYAGRTLPEGVYKALMDFADGRAGAALLLRDCPVGDVPETPEAPHLARKFDLVSETTLLTIARVLGQPVGYAPEHGGDLVQNVCPTKSHATSQTSTSSAVVLELHTEAAFHPVRPRYLALLCLRGDPQSATTLTSVRDLVEHLDEADRLLLSQPLFTTGVDESYTGVRGQARSRPAPILSGHPDSPRLWLDNDLMQGIDAAAEEVLHKVASLARDLAQPVVLQAGDMLIVDNDAAVHGRTPFTPRFDGTDRWLQRALVVGDHRAAGGDLDGRIIVTEFNLTP